MKYDSNQISLELKALAHNKDLTFQQYHKICGAIEMLEAMQKTALQGEKEEQEKINAEENSEIEPVCESESA
jgi:hypothetical protein